MLTAIRHIILGIIDFFHRPFSRWIDKQTFRYLASGSSGAALNIAVVFVSYNFILQKQDVVLPFITIRSAVAAAAIAFVISTPYGFLMSRYIVFSESNLKTRVQLFRYLMTVAACAVLTYFFLPFFVYTCGIFPTPASILTTAIVAVFSYVSQRFFTFKVKDEVASEVKSL